MRTLLVTLILAASGLLFAPPAECRSGRCPLPGRVCIFTCAGDCVCLHTGPGPGVCVGIE